MADTRQSQGCTLGWYASPRWGGFRLIFTIAKAMNPERKIETWMNADEE
jgi:hypothetical protein